MPRTGPRQENSGWARRSSTRRYNGASTDTPIPGEGKGLRCHSDKYTRFPAQRVSRNGPLRAGDIKWLLFSEPHSTILALNSTTHLCGLSQMLRDASAQSAKM